MGCINNKRKIIIKPNIDIVEIKNAKSLKSYAEVYLDPEENKNLEEVKKPNDQYISSDEISEMSNKRKSSVSKN